MNLRPLPLLLLLAALPMAAHAQFAGDYALTPPSGGLFTTDNPIGAWALTFNGSGSGSLNTSGAPNSFVLAASATGLGVNKNSRLGIASVTQNGTITFDYVVSIFNDFTSVPMSMGMFNYGLNGNTSSISFSGSNSVVWNVQAGDSIFFNAFGSGSQMMSAGGAGGIGGIGGIGGGPISTPTTGSASVTISNFTFTPAAVPEPAEFAIAAGVLALGAALYRRKKT